MSFLTKIQEGYQSLWKLIIRPQRNSYSTSFLGSKTMNIHGNLVKRIDVELVNPRGLTFHGSHYIPANLKNYPCVIYSHRNCSNRLEGTEYLGQLIKEGISLMTYDFSGCGNAEGDYITLGWYEWEDLAQVITYLLKKQEVTNIGLWGRSMGAVTSLMYLRQDEIIKAAVFDSPFKSLKTVIEQLAKKNSSAPSFVIAGLIKIVSKTIQNKAGFDIYKLNPVEEASKISTPGFFITALDDEIVSPVETKQVYKSYGGPKHFQVIQGDHNSNRPPQCINQAIKFLKSHLFPRKSKQQQQKPTQKQEHLQQQLNNSLQNHNSQDQKVFDKDDYIQTKPPSEI